jgi:hypothetical protein
MDTRAKKKQEPHERGFGPGFKAPYYLLLSADGNLYKEDSC